MLLIAAAFAQPVPTPERGLYDEPLVVEATGDLLYSTDGSTPSLEWPGSIDIETTTTLRLWDPAEGLVVTHSYVFVDDVVETLSADILADPAYEAAIHRTLRELPTIVLTTGALSLTEQETAFEWIDGVNDTQIDSGVRIQGGHSVNYAKTNLRLNFRGEYGYSRLYLNLYEDFATGVPPADDFDALTLRGGSHDSVFYLGASGQYLRNRWMDESQLEMGHIAPHGRYAHVYLNGGYHGLYHVRERFDAAMLAEYLGGSEDDYEAVNSGAVIDGSGAAWSMALANAYDFEGIQDWVNLENFLDYMVLQFYAGNAWDWYATHNWMAAGHSTTGGYLFHSSDSDICLYYDHTVDILDLPGPSSLFASLLASGSEDFMVLWGDRLHAHLVAEDGTLRPEAAAERYERLSLQIEDAVVAESARWGSGWTRDEHWAVERARLMDEYFPFRTDTLLEQVRAKGWLTLPAPVFTIVGPSVRVETVDEAELWVTLDGSDPRLSEDALGPGEFDATVEYTTQVSARLYDGGWGPIETRRVEVDRSPPVLLNEWNAVDDGEWLSGGDSTLGELESNGGDWLELLVVEDLDLHGWRLELEDRSGTLSSVELGADPVLGEVRAGTLITIAEALPEDLAYAPEVGDWRFHLVDEDLDVSHREWSLTVWDERGRIRLGPVGEGHTVVGLGKDEVGVYADGEHIAQESSTFGAPNTWDGGVQDLSAMRGEEGRVGPEREVSARSPPGGEPVGCAGSILPILLLLACARETVSGDSAPACFEDGDGDGRGGGGPPACPVGVPNDLDCDDADARVHPSAYEVCNELDDDCNGEIDDEVVDGIALFVDADGDGYGGEELVSACSVGDGAAANRDDCDDGDAGVHPDAVELCDGVDRNCDGVAGDHLGASEACPAESCSALAEEDPSLPDGAYFIELEIGPTALYCDLSGGGWTLGFLRNSAGSGNHGGFGGSDEDADQLDLSPEEASSSVTGRRGWIDLNAFPFTELKLAAYASGVESYRSETILRESLRIDFGDNGYLLYGDPYYWCGGDASYTDSGVGATNNPDGAYLDCKGHGSLGSGWDFSDQSYGNAGLTLCGSDASNFLASSWGGGWITYGTPGGAQAIWVR